MRALRKIVTRIKRYRIRNENIMEECNVLSVVEWMGSRRREWE